MPRLDDLWEHIRRSRTLPVLSYKILPDHIINQPIPETKLESEKQYVQIIINQMSLKYNRQWFKVYDPMTFVALEFIYDKNTQTDSSMVGPSKLNRLKQDTPRNILFSNILAAGPYPYRGGGIELGVVLYKIKKIDYLGSVLNLIENTASTLTSTLVVDTYMKVVRVLKEGLETILGMKDTEPLLGHYQGFNSNRSTALRQGYFVLINSTKNKYKSNDFWVDEGQLRIGSDPKSLKEFTDTDYILYSVMLNDERDDVRKLAFYEVYERALEAAVDAKEDDLKEPDKKLKTIVLPVLRELNKKLIQSPDLIREHAAKLSIAYKDEVLKQYRNANQRISDDEGIKAVEKKLQASWIRYSNKRRPYRAKRKR